MRLELKYLVPLHLLDQIRSDVLIYTDYDKHVLARPDKQYTVRSIYYDTMRLEYYYEKVAGIKRRKKIRIRGYNKLDLNKNSNPAVFLEIKRKNNNFISKNRSRVLYHDLENLLTSGDIDQYILPDKNRDVRNDAGKFLFHYFHKSLKPVVLIVYEREAFFSKFDAQFRVSFDKNLRSRIFPAPANMFDNAHMKSSLMGKFVLEVKYSGPHPRWMKDLIYDYRLTQRPVSKYTISLDQHKIWQSMNKFRIYGTA